MVTEPVVADAELRAAIRRGKKADETEPRAASAHYDDASGRVVLELTNGCSFAFPAGLGEGLSGASPEQLARVELMAGGRALRWDELDVDLGVAPLLSGIFGTAAWMRALRSEMARAGGRVSSAEKARAARENGKKGGRPRKQQPDDSAAQGSGRRRRDVA